MTNLKALQDGFAAAMLRGDPGIGEDIVSDASASAGERLEIYAHAYVARLQESLEVEFPSLLSLLGDDFYALTREYIRDNPSQHPSIRWFGAHLSDWVMRTEPWSAQPALSELAAFEWALSTVFDAPNQSPVKLEDLMAIEPEYWGAMRLVLVEAHCRLDLWHNVAPVCEALRAEREAPSLVAGEDPVGWLIWRRQLDPHWRSLSADEAWALGQCRQGACFAEICAGLCEWVDEANAPMRAVELLRTWIEDELIAGLEIDA